MWRGVILIDAEVARLGRSRELYQLARNRIAAAECAQMPGEGYEVTPVTVIVEQLGQPGRVGLGQGCFKVFEPSGDLVAGIRCCISICHSL